MSDAKWAKGTFLKKGTVTIAEVTSITGPNVTAETIDVTSHSTTDNFREYIAGWRDGGTVTIEGNFTGATNSGQDTLLTDLQDGTVASYSLVFPNSMQWTFSAIVTEFQTTAPHDGKLGFSASFKITGKPTLGPVV